MGIAMATEPNSLPDSYPEYEPKEPGWGEECGPDPEYDDDEALSALNHGSMVWERDESRWMYDSFGVRHRELFYCRDGFWTSACALRRCTVA